MLEFIKVAIKWHTFWVVFINKLLHILYILNKKSAVFLRMVQREYSFQDHNKSVDQAKKMNKSKRQYNQKKWCLNPQLFDGFIFKV